MADLAEEFEDAQGRGQYSTMAGLARWSFSQAFWREDAGCLYDVIDTAEGAETVKDVSIRPNQILAVSLHYTMLTKERAERMVELVRTELLTPFGLRTLATGDPQYQGRYTGGQAERDAAYHQGTVWPWLLGPFISAYLRVHEGSEVAVQQAAKWLEPLEAYLMNEGVGQIAEIFEGDAPHRAVGCFAQAWSVAELLRVRAEIASGAS
jgi:glycogen debranching enzyme